MAVQGHDPRRDGGAGAVRDERQWWRWGAGKGRVVPPAAAALVRMCGNMGTGGITGEREGVRVRVECVDPMTVDDCTNLKQ